jgi:ATP-dependent helicase/nuclease subunit A
VAHAHAAPVIAALEARGLPVLGVDLVPLRERMIVRDLVQLTRALYDPADRPAWLAVLRAPWCGARLTTLTALSGPDRPELLIESLGNPARLARCDRLDLPRLARLHEILTGALARRPAAAPADWVETTWVRLGGSDAYPAADLADARAFFDALAARTATLDWRGPQDLPALLEKLCSASSAGENPVQVMTIHRAKGLEFDHVIVPALERPPRPTERRLLRWVDLPGEGHDSDLVIAPPSPVGAGEEGGLNAYVSALLREREAHERGRLMYVAATRGRRTLWLSGAPALGADGAPRTDRRSLLATLWPALGSRFECAAEAPATATTAPAAALIRLRSDWQPAEVPPAVPLTRLPPAFLASEPPEFSWVGETQRHIGTVVHAWLVRLAQAPQLPSPEAIGAQSDTVLAQLARSGLPPGERARALELILSALQRTLADPRGRWILSAAHREAHSEWQLSGVGEGRLRNVVVDRSFIDADGTRWVIDYKTSAHEGGDLEAFLASELERYRLQLLGYRALAAAHGPQPVRVALYFPLLGAFRELG